MLAAAVFPAQGPACGDGGSVLSEDFDDGILDGDLWAEVETNAEILTVDEANMHLEFEAVDNVNQLEVFAGYLANGWAIELDRDFSVRIDWHFDVPSAPLGEVGMAFVLVAQGVPEELLPNDAVSIQLGIDQDFPYIGYEVFHDGLLILDDFAQRFDSTGTTFVWYEASSDELRFSTVGFQDPDAVIISGIQTLSGSCQVVVWFGAFSDGLAPGFGGDAVFFDDFEVATGNVVPFCPADLDCDEVVGITDFLTLLALWGTDPGGPPDLDNDGNVGITDFLTMLADWGPC